MTDNDHNTPKPSPEIDLDSIDYEALIKANQSQEDAKAERRVKLLIIAAVSGLSALNWQPLWHQIQRFFSALF